MISRYFHPCMFVLSLWVKSVCKCILHILCIRICTRYIWMHNYFLIWNIIILSYDTWKTLNENIMQKHRVWYFLQQELTSEQNEQNTEHVWVLLCPVINWFFLWGMLSNEIFSSTLYMFTDYSHWIGMCIWIVSSLDNGGNHSITASTIKMWCEQRLSCIDNVFKARSDFFLLQWGSNL